MKGHVVSRKHYMLPVLDRLSDINSYIAEERYFVLHAPRQSRKTTYIKALADKINNNGQYYALYCSLESLQGLSELSLSISEILENINKTLRNSQMDILSKIQIALPNRGITVVIGDAITEICKSIDKELILFFDEADCLAETPLITFLRQLRQGYNDREDIPFPRSIALIGLRNIRDYKAKIHPEPKSIGSASPFNIATALTLPNFTVDKIAILYDQHTEATGQIFEKEAIARAWYWSEGQPWLVNALAKHAVEKELNNDYSLK